MSFLNIIKKPKTPKVDFDGINGHLSIYGVSVPENPNVFYEPLIDWLKKYLKSPQKNTQLDFKLSYVNTSSLQYIYDFLMLLDDADGKKTKVKVNWYFLKDDSDTKEMGEDFKAAVKLEFSFIGVKDI